MSILWVPSTDDMVMWIDPSNTGSVTGTTTVTAIADLSSSGHGGTNASATPFSLVSNAMNGLNALSSVGTSYMTIASGGVPNTSVMTCFQIFKRVTSNIVSIPTGCIDGQYAGLQPIYWISDTTGFSSYNANTLYLPANTTTGNCLITTAINRPAITTRLNGAVWGSTANVGSDTHFSSLSAIGRNISYWHNGYIGEVIICDAAVEYEKIEGYLAHKWGVTLHSSHPYFASPPLDIFWTNFHGQSEI